MGAPRLTTTTTGVSGGCGQEEGPYSKHTVYGAAPSQDEGIGPLKDYVISAHSQLSRNQLFSIHQSGALEPFLHASVINIDKTHPIGKSMLSIHPGKTCTTLVDSLKLQGEN